MKKILLVILIVAKLFFAKAQTDTQIRDSLMKLYSYKDTPVMKTTSMDGNVYEVGFSDEVNQQNGLESQQLYLCRLIGFKAYYSFHIPKFLTSKGELTYEHLVIDEDAHTITYNIVPSVMPNGFYGKAKAVVNFNDDVRIKSLTITGNPSTLIYLFVHYWSTIPHHEKLKVGGVFTKYFLDERITLRYTNFKSATLTVKKRF